MNDVAISVRNVSKSYHLYTTPKDRVKELLHPLGKKYHKDFWALKDVSFEVKKGETVGIIGRNGSGKSTLLQLLCGVLQPTAGEVKVNGRISALLELGAGFNRQFTGRENVYMNGALMGFTKEEMDERFQMITDFAEIGEFIDQPVRMYSSGMFIRLAFSCAVNVDPDILVVDEALAVGDAKFQKKCYDKMNVFKEQGRTIVLVTHGSIKGFVSKGILLGEGSMLFNGDATETESRYFKLLYPANAQMEEKSAAAVSVQAGGVIPSEDPANEINRGYSLEVIPKPEDAEKGFGAGGAWINWIKIYGLEKPNIFHGGETIKIVVSYSWDKKILKNHLHNERVDSNLLFGVAFESNQAITITGMVTTLMESREVDVDPMVESSCIFTYEFEMPILASGFYFLSPGIALGRQSQHITIQKYINLVQLNCMPTKRWIFGLLNWPVKIRKQGVTVSL